MQTLQFHSKWEKTIAEKDRQSIEEVFKNTCIEAEDTIEFTLLSQAVNHKGELLLITLIHNTTNQNFTLNNQTIGYKTDEQNIIKHSFTYPTLTIPPKTSTPWTFIFPQEVPGTSRVLSIFVE
ncbi:SLAP domain-containing protein [Oceanobacillus limi]|uniref:SLAP domain-containing protein n=1 Tax=Oceanobacillus limi TaxID=930131 RepID=A0A1I0CCD8_9BACI|nr:SLAP domain-containing protein [Oceanobacillus limi]SET16939.1 SLAP domain-containing protein [Oceanobacillus limi]